MTYLNLSDCQNQCSNGFCSGLIQANKQVFGCSQNPVGTFNTKSVCETYCTIGYCNQAFNYNHSRYEYTCTANEADIYNSFNQCDENCFYNCDTTYNYAHTRYEYVCMKNESFYFLLFLIPVPIIILLICCCCCCKKKVRQAEKKEIIRSEGVKITEITLPNGQTGFFVPLSLPQKVQTNQVQIYQPTPIYQEQIIERTQIITEMPVMPAMPM
ncbi:Hypothetical_protein [Hexamita inflata]|uniref:Hypothetical_protein n=1 Tax=Hexamita inflata TaxID=28002 RepID=A0AA86TTH6_9EUKA|nr:Hypothetical protein HINF_LOCUS15974 [Hexamita inflata]